MFKILQQGCCLTITDLHFSRHPHPPLHFDLPNVMLQFQSTSSSTARHLLRLSSHMASHSDFFSHTSGRFLRRDQHRRQALLYRQFDVGALETVAASSAGSDGALEMHKLTEGRFNKNFKITTNRKDVVARISTPLAGPAHLVTASEVATMRFLRDRLGLKQVPQVLSWSSQASDTPVGAEYIIMDIANGVELRQVWHDLTNYQKLKVVQAWVDFESKVLKAFSGGGYGSLYHRNDLPADLSRNIFIDGERDENFVLGPSTVRSSFWEDECGPETDIKRDHGPCKSVQDNANHLLTLL